MRDHQSPGAGAEDGPRKARHAVTRAAPPPRMAGGRHDDIGVGFDIAQAGRRAWRQAVRRDMQLADVARRGLADRTSP
jgi:hypothetical protein